MVQVWLRWGLSCGMAGGHWTGGVLSCGMIGGHWTGPYTHSSKRGTPEAVFLDADLN